MAVESKRHTYEDLMAKVVRIEPDKEGEMPSYAPDGSARAANVGCGASDPDRSRESCKESPGDSTQDIKEEEYAGLMEIEVAISHTGRPLNTFDESMLSIDLDQI